MSETRFTPGPWACSANTACSEGGIVATTKETKPYANAHLISAAPEMYELLEQISNDWTRISEVLDVPHALAESVSAVLAKARGETT